jgi:outer membrane protein W
MKKIVLASLLAFAAMSSAHAQAGFRPARFVLGGGFTFGGDKLATVAFTNGQDQDIRAGGLFAIHAGVDMLINDQMSVQATVGYHSDSSSGGNGSLRFARFPVELLGYVHLNPQVRVGGGVRLVNSPELNGSGVVSGLDVSFDNTVGGVIEGEYFFSPNFGLKLRAVSETYRVKNTGFKVNGGHVGIYGNFYF